MGKAFSKELAMQPLPASGTHETLVQTEGIAMSAERRGKAEIDWKKAQELDKLIKNIKAYINMTASFHSAAAKIVWTFIT